jgi:hypothetical protein
MLNSTVFPKPYTHTPTHTGISQRRAPQTKLGTTVVSFAKDGATKHLYRYFYSEKREYELELELLSDI